MHWPAQARQQTYAFEDYVISAAKAKHLERAREHVRIGFPRTHRIRIVDSTNRRDRSAILLKRLATGQPVINVKLHERQRPKP